jgi:hypothetical protein
VIFATDYFQGKIPESRAAYLKAIKAGDEHGVASLAVVF